METSLSIPDSVFMAADDLARRMGISRDELYATAVAEFVARQTKDAEVTARLDRLYAVEDSSLDPVVRRAQAASIIR
jgi:predicted transcriptional regulator